MLACEIKLLELREPLETDWDGKIKIIQTNSTIELPVIKQIEFIIDEEWLLNKKIESDIAKEGCITLDNDIFQLCFHENKYYQIIKYPNLFPKLALHTNFYDESCKMLYSIQTVIDFLTPGLQSLDEEFNPDICVEEIYNFNKPTYLKTKDYKITKVKINGIKVKFSVERMTEKSKIDLEKSIKYILRDILGNSDRMFSKEDFD